ncbi:phosphopantetheine adenylyltransferase [Formosa sp. Hel3_A1_48]|jgi:pantetheine-phosphate adenylyltransferase|uniref:pantetheine-phosphate adenylyltransferase n=1 Tax=Formosa sp. Hel3_A1_48 TaxID=1336795 RepID=UPI00084E25E7|nr:pantetheine-phosphate adenylyltransferase [Formosa sp. Hel3_A1_48]MDA9760956.1 pantetheine-phosphate adenylyltransferase [Flavobacteriaceae bacterium]AOR25808.1 phosphopantetheine adenylyltransferase [Formosa sp. Hel3_A1_48]MDA9847037.1 pantetheine-phosphate adenylyltransferase [Flavobacteriaceae bacterium]MDC0635152.1 pantetheine-phosphate adenylyltransferase [Flavobacteriaceae bacterium]MDC0950845.1 pantetheine-phosphate adenylyltransferase [Flavobacteriaceae bacterium]
MKRAIFPGSFDPITLGHCDIIHRGVTLFDEVIVAIGENSAKDYMFSLEERKSFIENTFEGNSKIRVMTYSGLTTDFCKKINADFILRGLRNPADFEFEKAIAHTNRNIGDIETVFLLTSVETSFISSSIVREIIHYQGDYKKMVPAAVYSK